MFFRFLSKLSAISLVEITVVSSDNVKAPKPTFFRCRSGVFIKFHWFIRLNPLELFRNHVTKIRNLANIPWVYSAAEKDHFPIIIPYEYLNLNINTIVVWTSGKLLKDTIY